MDTNNIVQRGIGYMGAFIGALATQWWYTKFRIARQTRKPVSSEEAIEEIRRDLMKLTNDYHQLRDVTVGNLEKQIASLDIRQETDRRDILRELGRMNEALLTISESMRTLRERFLDA